MTITMTDTQPSPSTEGGGEAASCKITRDKLGSYKELTYLYDKYSNAYENNDDDEIYDGRGNDAVAGCKRCVCTGADGDHAGRGVARR
jgi:hypothetical protein